MELNNAPQPTGVITSMKDRLNAGIGVNYVDTFNDLQMAKYNNEYNYWLWHQQNEYNTPAAQMQRAREAGLNPNVIAGNVSSGNAASPSASAGRLSGNVRSNQMQSMNAALNSFNSIINSIASGVSSVSKLSGIPSDIPTYRKLLNKAMHFSTEGTFLSNKNVMLDALLKQLDIAVNSDRNYEMNEANWEQLAALGGAPNWLLRGTDGSASIPLSRVAKLSQAEVDAAQRKLDLISEQINNLVKQGLHIDADTVYKTLQSRLTEKELQWFTANSIEKYLMDGFGAFLNYRSKPFYR